MVPRRGWLGAGLGPSAHTRIPPLPTHTPGRVKYSENHISALPACPTWQHTLATVLAAALAALAAPPGLLRGALLSLLLQEDGGHQENRARGQQQETLRHARDARGWSHVHVCHVRCWSQVSVMCDDHYCHTPAPLPQLTLPMQMSLIASPSPPHNPPPPADVHLLDLIKVMRERGRGGRTGNWGTEDERSWLKKKKERTTQKRGLRVCVCCVCVRKSESERWRQSMESRNVSKSPDWFRDNNG